MINGIGDTAPLLETNPRTEGAGNVKKTNQSFDWGKKIDATQKSLLNTAEMLSKKCAVKNVGVFRANMNDEMSFGAKVKQLFENIKLKLLLSPEESISEDCDKLEQLLTEGVADVIQRGKDFSVTKSIEDLKDRIGNCLQGVWTKAVTVPSGDKIPATKKMEDFRNKINEFLNNPEKHHNSKGEASQELYVCSYCRLYTLKEHVKTLYAFSMHADNLNDFHASYTEPTADDIDYCEECDGEYKYQDKKGWQPQQIAKLDEAKAFLESVENTHPLRLSLAGKISRTEDKFIGNDEIREFYKDIDVDKKYDAGEMASKCNKLIQKLKSMEEWLHAVDPDFKDLTPEEDKHPTNGRFWRFSNGAQSIAENTPERDETIQRLLGEYIKDHPNRSEYSIGMYYGIPCVVDRTGKLVPIK